MALIAELPRIEQWIVTMLTSDGTVTSIVGGRIYPSMPTQNVPLNKPMVIYTLLSAGEDMPAAGGGRILANPLYLIKGVCQGISLTPIQTLADRIDALFHGQKGGHSDMRVHASMRERAFRMDEYNPKSNERFQHLGGEFRIRAAALDN